MIISLLCLISSDIHELINYATFFETMFIGLTVASLMYMRRKYPELARPLKVRFSHNCLFILLSRIGGSAINGYYRSYELFGIELHQWVLFLCLTDTPFFISLTNNYCLNFFEMWSCFPNTFKRQLHKLLSC